MRRIALFHSLWFAVLSALVIFGCDVLLNMLTHSLAGDVVATVYFGLYGLYCLQNYLACREVHCMITAPGFLLAAILMLLRITGLFDHGYGVPYIMFGLSALLGHGLEWSYAKRTGSRFRTATKS